MISKSERVRNKKTSLNIDEELTKLKLKETQKKNNKIKNLNSKLLFNLNFLRKKTNDLLAQYPLFSYAIKRITLAFITILIAISVIFVLLRLVTPDSVYLSDVDIAKLKIAVDSPEYKTLLAERMKIFGVYGSIWDQLLTYLKNITPFIKKTIKINSQFDPASGKLVFDTYQTWFYLGAVFSPAVSQPGDLVATIFQKAIPYSFAFGSISLLIAYIIGVPLGIICAKNKEKFLDHSINTTTISFLAIPPVILVIVIYQISINFFGAHGLFTSGTFDTKIWPIIALVLMITPPIILSTRRYVIDEMTSDYAKFALSKGMNKQYVFYIHIFRNAGIRVFRLLPGAFIATIFGASIFVEQSWAIPGMSKFIISGVSAKDSFVVMAYILITSVAGVFTSLLADIIMVVLDPRVKLTNK